MFSKISNKKEFTKKCLSAKIETKSLSDNFYNEA